MVILSKKSINVLGSEANFIKFYHTDFIKFLKNTKSNLEILTTVSEKGNYVFEGVSSENIKRFSVMRYQFPDVLHRQSRICLHPHQFQL